ncbi:hypothetical protein [Propionivibrio sp.]|uniref:hypothetical protein n=1 Tax=Propionivibrio sp. TaxID=2212460 RepID=UPI003BEF7A61
MPKTAAQRQAMYRARRPFAGTDGNGERRLNLWISTHANLALERLARHYCVTKREFIERLVTAEEERILSTIILDSNEWNNYFQIAPVTQ